VKVLRADNGELIKDKKRQMDFFQKTDKTFCLANGGEWITPLQNHNNIFFSMLTFFEVQLLEDWFEPIYRSIDSTPEKQDQGPKHNNRFGIAFMYYGFIFLMSLFILNLFISILI
jgi:hypothetical protein